MPLISSFPGIIGASDATSAVQAALNTGQPLVFDVMCPIYGVLTINTPGQELLGYWKYPNEYGGGGLVFYHDGICLLVRQPQCAVTSLKIVGPRSGNDVAIRAEKLTNTDDIDIAVTNSLFKSCTTGINVLGRSLNASENLFANNTVCVRLEWPSSGTEGENEQALPKGWRGTRIIDNRAHSCTKLVVTDGPNRHLFRGAQIIGNQMDIGERLFEGGIKNSNISDNIIEFSNTAIVYIDAGGDGLSITGNQFKGTQADPAQSPAYSVWFDTGSTPKHTSIVGNQFAHTDTDAIRIAPDAEYLTITGNGFSDIANTSSTGACIKFQGNLSNSTITANTFNPINVNNCISVSGVITNTSIIANPTQSGATLITGGYTDGGGNIVQTNGRINYGGLTLPLRALEATTTSSIAARLTRAGSTYGVGLEFLTDAGSLSVVGSPSGINAGSLSPSVDNAIELGEVNARWKIVRSINGITNISDRRKKKNIRQIDLKILKAWSEVGYRQYLMKDDAEGKLNFGLIAQDIIKCFAKYGLDAEETGLVVKESSGYSVNYQQVSSLESAYIRHFISIECK